MNDYFEEQEREAENERRAKRAEQQERFCELPGGISAAAANMRLMNQMERQRVELERLRVELNDLRILARLAVNGWKIGVNVVDPMRKLKAWLDWYEGGRTDD